MRSKAPSKITSASYSKARIVIWHQARVVQEPPEAVRVAGEVMTELRRSDARIDADKQHADRRPDAIT